MRSLIWIALIACASQALAATDWLWRNADQRGEALLHQGRAAAAAKVYADPHRKGYAEIRAGDYAAAARDLDGVDGADYNRGIALAHTGDLQGALHAFDAALKRDPHDRDARHNCDLVENALASRKHQEPGTPSQSGSTRHDEQNSPARKENQDQSSEQGKQPRGDQTNPAGNPGSANRQNAPQANPSASRQRQHNAAASAQQERSSASQLKGQQTDKQQAVHDAAASLAGNTDNAAGHTGQALPSEKQLAQEQWLRNIPDDPGGLLRRKFLIEYMMRKQQP